MKPNHFLNWTGPLGVPSVSFFRMCVPLHFSPSRTSYRHLFPYVVPLHLTPPVECRRLPLPDLASLLSASGTRQRLIYTRQRALGKQFIGTDLFAECTLSGTRQRHPICRVPIRHSAKKSGRDGGFAEYQSQALGKGIRFAERH